MVFKPFLFHDPKFEILDRFSDFGLDLATNDLVVFKRDVIFDMHFHEFYYNR
jgi:hypothetical protein